MKRQKESKTRTRRKILDRDQTKRLDKTSEKINGEWREVERTKERRKRGKRESRKVERKREKVEKKEKGKNRSGNILGGRRNQSQRKRVSESGKINLERSVERKGRAGSTGKREKEIRGSIKKRREKQRKRRAERTGKDKPRKVIEWKEQIARVGTGYRVRKDEKDSTRRRFDVGYSDRKVYKRKDGREGVIDQSNIGRTLTGKGEDSRVKVMNAVCQIEKRRRVSDYTGSGIRRKSQVGKRKLKPTKPQSKS